MPKNRLPAVTDRVVWEKVTKGRAGIGWDSVAEEVCKEIGGNQEEICAVRGQVWGGTRRKQKKG